MNNVNPKADTDRETIDDSCLNKNERNDNNNVITNYFKKIDFDDKNQHKAIVVKLNDTTNQRVNVNDQSNERNGTKPETVNCTDSREPKENIITPSTTSNNALPINDSSQIIDNFDSDENIATAIINYCEVDHMQSFFGHCFLKEGDRKACLPGNHMHGVRCAHCNVSFVNERVLDQMHEYVPHNLFGYEIYFCPNSNDKCNYAICAPCYFAMRGWHHNGVYPLD